MGAYDDDNDAFEDPLEVELADWLDVTSKNSLTLTVGSILVIIASVVLVTVAASAIGVATNKFYVS